MQIETITEMGDNDEITGVTVHVRDGFPDYWLVAAIAQHAVAEDALCDSEDVKLEMISSPWTELTNVPAGDMMNYKYKAAQLAERNKTVFRVIWK